MSLNVSDILKMKLSEIQSRVPVKIKGFVDKIIKFKKENGVTKVE
jgi:hypothetical protein